MSGLPGSFVARILQRQGARRWASAADKVQTIGLSELHRLSGEARRERADINRLLHGAEARLAHLPMDRDGIDRPAGCDWGWRPNVWAGPIVPTGTASPARQSSLGEGLSLYHDCPRGELIVRQVRSSRSADPAPFALRLEAFAFEGSFLSFALDLPREALLGLRARHLIRLSLDVEIERPLAAFCRLNVRQGQNTEQFSHEQWLSSGRMTTDFDLAPAHLKAERVEKVWLDLVFTGIRMNRIVLRDLTLARYPRANI